MKNKIEIICGATATGKSEFAIKRACKLKKAVIINADSMQVYKEIPIITAQPTTAEKKLVQHALYGIISVQNHFSAGTWLDLAIPIIQEASLNNKTPIIVGGTGLYLKSLIYGISEIEQISEKVKEKIKIMQEVLSPTQLHQILYDRDPLTASKLNPNDSIRIARALEVLEQTGQSISHWHNQKPKSFFERKDFYITFINPSREEIYENINKRFVNMFENGAIEEVKKLPPHNPKAIGVKQIQTFLRGDITKEEAIKKAQQESRNYAKRQLTWFNNQLDYDFVLTAI